MAREIGDGSGNLVVPSGAPPAPHLPDEIVGGAEVLDDLWLAIVRNMGWCFSRLTRLHAAEELVRRGTTTADRTTTTNTVFERRRAYLIRTGPALAGDNVTIRYYAWALNSQAAQSGDVEFRIIRSSDGVNVGTITLNFTTTAEAVLTGTDTVAPETDHRVEVWMRSSIGTNTLTLRRIQIEEDERTLAQMP